MSETVEAKIDEMRSVLAESGFNRMSITTQGGRLIDEIYFDSNQIKITISLEHING